MKVNPQVNNYLMVKYFSGNVGRTFNILIDGTLLKEETIQDRNPGNFYEEYYKLPQELIAGKRVYASGLKCAGTAGSAAFSTN